MKNNPKQKQKRISTAACLPVELRQKVEDYADQNKTSYSQAIERMIKEFFANQPARPESEALRKVREQIMSEYESSLTYRVGDIVYVVANNRIVMEGVFRKQSGIEIDFTDANFVTYSTYPKFIFRTRAEAEAYAQTLKGETNGN